MNQRNLFEDPPFQRHSRTSIQAASEVREKAPTLRDRVHRLIVSRGRYGATDAEIQQDLGMDPSTQRPRRVELVRAGRVVDSGTVRKTRSGRNATVWVAV